MAEEIKLKIKVSDDGSLKVTSRESKKAAKNLDKVAVSANTADRNLKGAAKASANSTKNFSKLQQGTGGLVGVYATLAAQVFAVSAAFQFLKGAADISNLIKGQEALGAATGVAFKTITTSIKDATDGQLAYAEAARAAAIGTAAGLSPEQLEKIGGAAKSASFALGRDLTDSFNRLVRGITKAEPELLDELGITLRLKDATEAYATAIGKNVKDLTAYERSQAVANDVLTQAEKKFGAIEKIMDPTAGALNRFVASFDTLLNSVKTGLTESLAPVFEFLSERTGALTSALALFAIPIVKSILPSFDRWERKAQDTLDAQKVKLDELGASYEKTRLDIENLGATQDKVLKKQTKSAGKVFKDLGIDTSGASKTGKKGIDFLAGGATNKQAQANAAKILKNAEKQLKTSLEVRTGYLAGANKKQVAELRASYEQRARILKKFEFTHASVWKRAGLQVKLYTTQSGMAWTRFQGLIVKGSKTMGKAVNGIFKIAGFIGIITLLYDLGKAAYEAFFPIEEGVKKAQEEVEGFSSKLEGLNDELDKTEKLVTKTSLLSLEEQVVAVGNAFNSADIVNKIKEFQTFSENTKGYEKAKKDLMDLTDTLSNLSPEFKKAIAGIGDLGSASSEQLDGLLKIQEAFKAASFNAQQLKDVLLEADNALRAFGGTGKGDDPTATLRLSLTRASTAAGLQASSIRDQLARQAEGDSDELKALKEERDRIAATRGTSSEFGAKGPSARKAEKARRLIAIGAEIEELEKKEGKLSEERIKQLKEEAKEVERIAEVRSLQAKVFEEASEGFIKRAKAIRKNNLEIAKGENIGVTFAQKRAQISNDDLKRTNKRLELEDKIYAASNALIAAQQDKGENNKAEIQARQDAVDAAVNEYAVFQAGNQLFEQRQDIRRNDLDVAERQLQIQKENLAIQRSIVALELQKSRADAGGLGVFGVAKTRQVLEADRALAAARVREAARGVQDATRDLALTRLQPSDQVSESDIQAKNDAVERASQELQRRREALRVTESTAAIFQEGVQAQTESLALQQQVISLNPIQERFNQLKLDALNRGVKAEELNLDLIMGQAKAQEELLLVTEQKQKLFDSIESNLTSALTSVIDGTASLKDAFADLAVSILKDLAAMIAKMLVFRALSSISGFGFLGFENGGVAGGGFQAFAMGGIAQGGISTGAYSSGGIVSRPTIGLVGEGRMNEAIVPLPDGKSIPVMMNGGGNSNVVVNVNIDNNGNSQQNTNADQSQGANLGNAIAAAVQRELQNQKRSGGILNPYGAA